VCRVRVSVVVERAGARASVGRLGRPAERRGSFYFWSARAMALPRFTPSRLYAHVDKDTDTQHARRGGVSRCVRARGGTPKARASFRAGHGPRKQRRAPPPTTPSPWQPPPRPRWAGRVGWPARTRMDRRAGRARPPWLVVLFWSIEEQKNVVLPAPATVRLRLCQNIDEARSGVVFSVFPSSRPRIPQPWCV
jgi:hypothetical protein